jgi:hypothetical protein
MRSTFAKKKKRSRVDLGIMQALSFRFIKQEFQYPKNTRPKGPSTQNNS